MPNWAERQAPQSHSRAEEDARFNYNIKPVPSSILVFGAAGHIGGPLAQHVRTISPGTHLRLATSNEARVGELIREFPEAEVVVADLLDVTTLVPALDGIEGAFIVTPDFLDTRRGMINFIAAADKAGSLKHVIRLQGENPEVKKPDDLPEIVKGQYGTALSHIYARQVFELVSDYLPITFLNALAYYMDDFLGMFGCGVRNSRTLAAPFDKIMTYIDTRDVGCAAANILLSDDIRDIGVTITIDNGHDYLYFSQVADLMTEVLGEKITYDGSVATFKRENRKDFKFYWGDKAEEALEFCIRYFEWEQQVTNCVIPRFQLEHLLGRKPVTFTEWLTEHNDLMLGKAEQQLSLKWSDASPERVHNPRAYTPSRVRRSEHAQV
jgi:uncharacterized protein YbjT (DUF2867 family)